MKHLSTHQKIAILVALYFAQGLPFGFFTQALPVILRERDVSLEEIGFSSLLALPWALKFLWAPIVDSRFVESVGRRRSWILPLQLLSIIVLIALGLIPDELSLLLGGVFVLNLLAATQDIATDGLAVDSLEEDERGAANGVQVAAYRIGMFVGGGAILHYIASLGMRGAFFVMAILLAFSSIPALLLRESTPPHLETAPSSIASSSPLRSFLAKPNATKILLLVIVFKLGDAFAQGMLRPFLSDAGYELEDLAALLGTASFGAGLLGALAGGYLVKRVGRKRSLWIFGVAQSFSVGSYAYLAATGAPQTAAYLICSVEHFTGGMATAALFTCMMDWSEGESGGTHYTVQASAVVIATGVAQTVSGLSASAIGYAAHFALGGAISLVGTVMAVWLFPSPGDTPAPIESGASKFGT